MTMLEHETDTILATLQARTIGERESILLRDILAADVPRGIKAYIQTETLRALEKELFASPQFSRVNRDAHTVRREARAFIASMASTYAYPREEYLLLLDNAIHFLENYLCRPQWTIEHFVFESGERMSAPDILAKLDCTVDYSYFRALIQKLIQRRGTREIRLEEFREMLIRIDDQVVKQHNARELALLAKPVFDFLLLRDTPPDVSIPLKPILIFFEDKKMKILRDYIESICRIRQRSEITLDELTTLVEDLYLGQTETPPPPAVAVSAPQSALPPEPEGPSEVPQRAEPDALPPPAEPPAGTEAQASQPSAITEPMDDQPAHADSPEEGDNEPDTSPLQFEETPADPRTIEIQAPTLFDYVTEDPDGREDGPPPDEPPARAVSRPVKAEPPLLRTPDAHRPPEPRPPRTPEKYERLFDFPEPPARLTDIRELIHGHARTRFVKHIFARDEDRYEDTISSLNESPTWKDAALILNNLYMAGGLDPFDPDVVEFTDAIHRRYLDAGKGGA